MTKLTLPIEIGKQYVRRDGKIVTAREVPKTVFVVGGLVSVCDPTSPNESPAQSHCAAYAHDGRIRDDGEDHAHDLVADHIPAKGHIHAALMAEYAKDAAECAEPWTRWEFLDPEGENEWTDLVNHPYWEDGVQYRRRPKTIKLGDREVNAPLRVAPADGTPIWLACVTCVKGADMFVWQKGPFDEWLEQGLLFATEEDAEAARLAILEMLKP